MFHIQYAKLFELDIRHGYHLNNGTVDFDDIADEKLKASKLAAFDPFGDLALRIPADTRRLMAGLGLLARTTSTGLTVLSECESEEIELDGADTKVNFVRREPDLPYRLRFVLTSRDSRLWNYTNLAERLWGTRRYIYVLSNRLAAANGRFNYLAAEPPTYAIDVEYLPGAVVKTNEASKDRFLATLVDKGIATPPNDSGNTWRKVGKHNYVGRNDAYPLLAPIHTLKINKNNVASAITKLTSWDGNTFDLEEYKTQDGDTLSEITVNTENVTPGLYTLKGEGKDSGGSDAWQFSERVYIDAELAGQDVVAVVEIEHTSNDAALDQFRLYREVNGRLILRSPEFRMQLLNQHTFWRFHFAKPPADGADLGDLEKVDDEYISKKAMPLTRGLQDIGVGSDTNKTNLPNPDVGRIAPTSARLYSDVYVQ